MCPIPVDGNLLVQMLWKGPELELAFGQEWLLFPKLPHHQKGSRMGRGSVVVYVGAQEGPVREIFVSFLFQEEPVRVWVL